MNTDNEDEKNREDNKGKQNWVCTTCGYVFAVKVENPEFGLEPPYDFDKLPEDWECPVCGASKADFKICKE